MKYLKSFLFILTDADFVNGQLLPLDKNLIDLTDLPNQTPIKITIKNLNATEVDNNNLPIANVFVFTINSIVFNNTFIYTLQDPNNAIIMYPLSWTPTQPLHQKYNWTTNITTVTPNNILYVKFDLEFTYDNIIN